MMPQLILLDDNVQPVHTFQLTRPNTVIGRRPTKFELMSKAAVGRTSIPCFTGEIDDTLYIGLESFVWMDRLHFGIQRFISEGKTCYCLEDFESRTGTFLNGKSIELEMPFLNTGDEITVGQSTFRFQQD